MLVKPIHSYSYERKQDFQLNRLMAFFSSFILLFIVSFFVSEIGNNIKIGYTSHQTINSEKYQEDRAVTFLNRSASYYYKSGAHHQALEELQLSHSIHPNKYDVNYITAITLISTCKQRGLYCEEAVAKLDYLNEYWQMDQQWIHQQYLTLGVNYSE